MDSLYCVYKHTSPSGKVYIGVTSMNPTRRWNNGHGYYRNPFFSKAIKKYGWDSFEHEIICDGLSKEEAEAMECRLIAEYHSNHRDYGYNITDGGEINKHHSEETKKKMSDAKKGKYAGELNPMYGKPKSEETKRRISNSLKGKMAGNKNPNYGKPMSDEQKHKISEARLGRRFPNLSLSMKESEAWKAVHERQKKPVAQYTKEMEFIRLWPSAADASLELIGHRRGQCNICSCANGHLATAYGFIWRHV